MLCNMAQRITGNGAWSIAVFASVLFLVACGGGGGGAAVVAQDTPRTVERPAQPEQPQPAQPQAQKVAFNVAATDGRGTRGVTMVELDAVEQDGAYIVQPVFLTVTIAIGEVPSMPIAWVVETVIQLMTVRDRTQPLVTFEGIGVGPSPSVEPGEPAEPADNNPPASEPPPPPSIEPPQTPVNNDPPPTPVNNDPLPSPEPVFSGSLVMAKVEFRYSKDANTAARQTILGCFKPSGTGRNDGWHIDADYCIPNSRKQQDAKVSESYFIFPDTGLNSTYTITLVNYSMRRTYPTVTISVAAGGSVVNTIVHNSWATVSEITNFYVPNFATITSSGATASVTAFTAHEFGVNIDPYWWDVGADHIHQFCNWRYRAVNPFVSVSFRYWQNAVCPKPAGASPKHTPNKSDIASGALQDIGARGFSFADSPAKFYARWGNKEKRKQAGFSYNFDTFALRTDYNKLPAAQDSGVMLDTYRVGVMPDIGKRHRLFAGVDNYRNGILAIQYSDVADADTHTNIYKLGSVAGKGGYAVKFEWRVVWE